jgi:hypothetical protein
VLVGGQPLALPLGTATVTWLGHWELQVGTATAALGVCPPPPTLSIIIFLGFPSPLFGVSRRKLKKCTPLLRFLAAKPSLWACTFVCNQSTLRRAVHQRNLIESIDPLLLSASCSSEVAALQRAVEAHNLLG